MPIINKGIFDTGDAFLRQTGNDWPTAQIISTADVIESSSNLYFSNIRVVQVVSPLLTTSNVVEVVNQYFSNIRVLQAVNPLLTTSNVIEGVNQYFSNVRVIDAVNPLLTTANVLEVGSNQYFTNAKAIAVVTPLLTTANVLETTGNLYFTNTRTIEAITIGTVTGNIAITGTLIANGLIIRNIAVSDSVLTGSTSANNIVADTITSNTWVNLYTANVIESANALYYTNSRTRSAFTAGRGILIQEDGLIKTTIGSDLYSTSIDGVRDFAVTSTLDNALVFPSTPTVDRFVLRSLHITNISDNTAYISANVNYATGNIARLATQLPVPVGGVLEFMGEKTQVFAPGDTIKLQGFDQTLTPASSKLSAYMTFETIPNDVTYYGVGETLRASNNDIMIADMTQSAGIFESIKFVNHKNTPIPVRLTVASANNTPKAYWAYNMQVPPQSSLEVLQTPKLLRLNDRLFARYDNASNTDSMSVFASYRLGSITSFVSGPGPLVSGNTGLVTFTTSIPDSTTLYYTLE